MPSVSAFRGITISMHYREHPPPHFHARHGEDEVTVEIESGRVTGRMTRRALQLIFEWMVRYRKELDENWELARRRKPLRPIPPLE